MQTVWSDLFPRFMQALHREEIFLRKTSKFELEI